MVDEGIFWKCFQITSLNFQNRELLLHCSGEEGVGLVVWLVFCCLFVFF